MGAAQPSPFLDRFPIMLYNLFVISSGGARMPMEPLAGCATGCAPSLLLYGRAGGGPGTDGGLAARRGMNCPSARLFQLPEGVKVVEGPYVSKPGMRFRSVCRMLTHPRRGQAI